MATQSSIPQLGRPLDGYGGVPTPHVSIEEYLHTAYSPDCDYVDGEVQERNLGEWDHSSIQGAVLAYLWNRRKEFGIRVVPEQRVQVTQNRFRVPDVVVTIGDPGEQVLTKPPFICIEVLSPEDRMTRMRQRVDDYLAMGVSYIWVIDPAVKVAYEINKTDGWREVKSSSLKTSGPEMEIPLSEIFA